MKMLTLPGLLMLATAGFAAEPDFLKTYYETRGYSLGQPVQPTLTSNGKAVLFLRAKSSTDPKMSLYQLDVESGKTTELVTPEDLLHGQEEKLSDEEKARRERQRIIASGISNFKLDPNEQRLLIQFSGKLYVIERQSKKVDELPFQGSITDAKWSPDGRYISYVRDHDIYVWYSRLQRVMEVTRGGTATKTHGVAEFVAQEEMDRNTGYWWSPDSTHIAYTEADHEGVETWDIADPSKPGTGVRKQFYPRPGEKNVQVRLGIKSLRQPDTVWVDPDWIDYEYLAAVHWDKLGGLTMQIQNRTQNVHKLLRVNPDDGSVTELLTEEVPTWFNINQSVPKWVDENRFLWISDVAGDSQLQLVDATTNQRKDLVHEDAQVIRVLKLIPETGGPDAKVLVQAGRGAMASTPWLVPIEGDPKEKIILIMDDISSMQVSDDMETRLLTYGDEKQWPQTRVQLPNGDSVELPSIAKKPPFIPNVEIEKLGDQWTAIVTPKDFDKSKKYPVIVDVYGGPHHNHVTASMRSYMIPQWLADHGFIVVAIDNRGTPDKGRDWEGAIYKKFGAIPLEDQVKGLQLLGKKHPEMDLERVGIVGWSFGGYMAANAVLREPEHFHAAVAGAPVTDWYDYDTHYTERYMGVPTVPSVKKAYEDSSLLPLAKNLQRPLLLVHGTADDNVYFRHTVRLADALFRAGKEFEMLPLAGITHMVSADAKVAEQLWKRNLAFFEKHLGKPK